MPAILAVPQESQTPRRPHRPIAAKPFVKWAGGKGRLLPEITNRLPTGSFAVYAEPFIGGGAVFWHMARLCLFEHAHINDANPDLMLAYAAVRDAPEELMALLDMLPNSEADYLRIRSLSHGTPLALAARLIYLNKTGFNGLYRVNAAGEFNTPYGHNPSAALYDEERIQDCALALVGADISSASYEAIFALAEPDWFLYCDPPYDAPEGQFTQYTAELFDQSGLADRLHELDARGVRWLLSNSDTESMRSLYAGFRIEEIVAPRTIAAGGTFRQPAREIMVRNY